MLGSRAASGKATVWAHQPGPDAAPVPGGRPRIHEQPSWARGSCFFPPTGRTGAAVRRTSGVEIEARGRALQKGRVRPPAISSFDGEGMGWCAKCPATGGRSAHRPRRFVPPAASNRCNPLELARTVDQQLQFLPSAPVSSANFLDGRIAGMTEGDQKVYAPLPAAGLPALRSSAPVTARAGCAQKLFGAFRA